MSTDPIPQIAQTVPNAAQTLHTFDRDDPCCARPLKKAAAAGALEGIAVWTCPKCGCAFRAVRVAADAETVVNWIAMPAIAVWKSSGGFTR